MDLGEVKMGTTALAEEDWADNWKKYYEPARITHDLTIVPSWTDYEATAGEKIIKLVPVPKAIPGSSFHIPLTMLSQSSVI